MPNAAAYQGLLLADATGVWALFMGVGFAQAYLTVPCWSAGTKLALTLGPAAVGGVWLITYAHSPAKRALGIAIQLIARLALLCTAVVSGATHWTDAVVAEHLALDALCVLGGVLNVVRLPERLLPGRFDLSPFGSHSLMHILTGAAMVLYHALSLRLAHEIHGSPDLLRCSRAGLQKVLG